jgi:hypothetical protein
MRRAAKAAALAALVALDTYGGLHAQGSRCSGFGVSGGLALPVGELADAVDPGWTATVDYSCALYPVGLWTALELEWLYAGTDRVHIRVLGGPQLRLASNAHIDVGAGWSFMQRRS